ncbi:MAG: hypothetical protein KZQ88_14875 [Candidatus Thiodiazotropha sp. (ex Dulcina madagascariensis)]|nr:hypothetical protein [Candidatus Thiodiazotropha sp. (ex Dulcina madagascariensis)]
MDIENSKKLALLLERQASELDNLVGWLRDVSHGGEQRFYIQKIAHILAISNDMFDKIYTMYPELKKITKS